MEKGQEVGVPPQVTLGGRGDAQKIQRIVLDSLSEHGWLLSAVLQERHQRVFLGILGEKKKIPASRGKKIIQNSSESEPSFLSPIKARFLRRRKATLCFLTKQWSTGIFDLNCLPDSLNFMTVVQLSPSP